MDKEKMEGLAYTSEFSVLHFFFRSRLRISHFRNSVNMSDFVYLVSLLGETPREGEGWAII